MQFEEWDLTFRLPLVVIVRRIHLYHLLPEADFLFWVHFLRPYPHLAISDLDRCVRVGLQVQVPCRVGRRAALRGDNHEIFAVHDVEKWARALPAGLPPLGIEEQDGTLAHTAEQFAACGAVYPRVRPAPQLQGQPGRSGELLFGRRLAFASGHSVLLSYPALSARRRP